MVKNLLSMFAAGLLVGAAANVAGPVSDWFVTGGTLVGVAIGLMLVPVVIAGIRAASGKLRHQKSVRFAIVLWAIWGIVALAYVYNTIFNLKLDLLGTR